MLAILVRRVEARTALLPQVTSSRRHHHGNDVSYLYGQLHNSSRLMYVLHILYYLNMLWIFREAAYADIFSSLMGLYIHPPGREKLLPLVFSRQFMSRPDSQATMDITSSFHVLGLRHRLTWTHRDRACRTRPDILAPTKARLVVEPLVQVSIRDQWHNTIQSSS